MLREKGCPRGRIPKGLSPWDRMERKLLTKRGRSLYKKRGVLVEPVFGQVKEGQGFRRFMRRGLGAAQSEWSLAGMTHNLLKLWGQERHTTFLGADKRPVELDGPTSLEPHRSYTCVSQLPHRSMRQTHMVLQKGPFWWRPGRVDLHRKHGLAVLVAVSLTGTRAKAPTLV